MRFFKLYDYHAVMVIYSRDIVNFGNVQLHWSCPALDAVAEFLIAVPPH